MNSSAHLLRTTSRRSAITVLSIVALALVLLAAGCASSSIRGAAMPSTRVRAASASASTSRGMMGASASASDGAEATSGVQTCAQCDGGKGAPPAVVGTVYTLDAVQVVRVGLANGYYSPNTFTIKAGMPVRVVFTGRASGCLARPTFASLGKQAGLAATGSATIDLGTLKPGVYKFTCAMGMNAGTITVR